jgi:hypothetical protein
MSRVGMSQATTRRWYGVHMAKRDNGTTRKKGGTGTDASGATAAEPMEQRVLAFAEQVGRIAGTLQAKAEGWMERETLNAQIARVRDGAADLLEQLAGGATKASNRRPAAATGVREGMIARSGGVVDAPGKKHRKPMPGDPDASLADSQAAKMRTVMTMTKTNRRRGRGWPVHIQRGGGFRIVTRASGLGRGRTRPWSPLWRPDRS